MPIVKSKHAGDYTVMPNQIMRSGMSLEAIGLLGVLLMNKHEWIIYKTTLHTTLKIGREKLDRIFKELQENGYILSVQKINQESGKFEYEHIVYDKPFNGELEWHEPSTGEPSTGLPYTANQPLISNNNNKEEYSKDSTPSPKSEEQEKHNKFIQWFNTQLGKKKDTLPRFQGKDAKTRRQVKAILATYKNEDIRDAMQNCLNDPYHIETQYRYVTPEYFTRLNIFEKYLNQ